MIFKMIYGLLLVYLTIAILWHRLVLHRIPGQIGPVFVYGIILVNLAVLANWSREWLHAAPLTKTEKN